MHPPDHGLPLVQLKELRREMVVALQNRASRVTDDELKAIAAVQQTISAFEEVIADLDCELAEDRSDNPSHLVQSFPLFGRRLAHSPA